MRNETRRYEEKATQAVQLCIPDLRSADPLRRDSNSLFDARCPPEMVTRSCHFLTGWARRDPSSKMGLESKCVAERCLPCNLHATGSPNVVSHTGGTHSIAERAHSRTRLLQPTTPTPATGSYVEEVKEGDLPVAWKRDVRLTSWMDEEGHKW